jgi:hypothetical protein
MTKESNALPFELHWEQVANFGNAALSRNSTRDLISQSQARGILYHLMHDVATISASFSSDMEITFEKCFEVSHQDTARAEFVGAYIGFIGDEPFFALRRFMWSGKFQSFSRLLAESMSQLQFVRLSECGDHIVNQLAPLLNEKIESGSVERLRIEREFGGNARTSYFVNDHFARFEISYRRKFACNAAIETIFAELTDVFTELNARSHLAPLKEGVTIRYRADWLNRLTSLANAND